MTYTKEAAETLHARSPQTRAGTIYSLTWPAARAFAGSVEYGGRDGGSSAYKRRTIRNEFDRALDDYEREAPSRQQRTSEDEQAQALHRWTGEGLPPFDLTTATPRGALKYLLPLARWLQASSGGRPATWEQFAVVIVDEAQDMSAAELAAAYRLVAPGGRLICYGDPGQAIFAEPKGLRADEALPAAWHLPGAVHRLMRGGHRCGDPVASAAARVLRPLWDRPASAFAAPHSTELRDWWPDDARPPRAGLVMGRSRADVGAALRRWGLRDTAVLPSVDSGANGLTVCTVHAAKGREADDVYLLPWSKQALERLDAGEPNLLRVLYVAITRARRRLFVPPPMLARLR